MTKLSKFFLLLSFSTFALSLTGPGSEFAYGGLKPTGAVLFIVFFITNLLSKEIAVYDKEHLPEKQMKTAPAQSEQGLRNVTQHA
ncbi:MAG TPA: hypothetical protein VGE41_11020 [Verrucomicrobiae bacterium]|jgi:hypothetical protein